MAEAHAHVVQMNTQTHIPTRPSATRASLTTTAAHNARWFASLIAGTTFLGSSAFATTWDGDVSADWNDNNNWSGNAGTGASNAIVSSAVAPPNIATISANIVATPVDIFVGSNAGQTGRLDHTAGTAATGGGNWMYIGHNGATGRYNLANTAVVGAGISGYGQGTGSMTVGGRIYVGGYTGTGGNGTVNMNTTGTLTVPADFEIGTSTGTGVVNLESGTIAAGNWFEVGNGTGCNGTLNMTGGAINKTGSNNLIVGANASTGVANVSGGTINVNNEFWVANNANSTGTLNVSGTGAIINGNAFAIGRNALTTNGTVNLSGGSITKNGSNHFCIGGSGVDATAAPGKGTLTQTGGSLTVNNEIWVGNNTASVGLYTLNAGTVTNGSWVAIGRGGGTGTVNMSGGTWTKNGAGTSFIVGASGPGTFTQSGGLVIVAAGDTWMGESNTCNFTLSGTGEFRATVFQVARNATATGNVNLNGGTLKANQIIGGGGTENIHFNGTQIIATGIQPSFISGIGAAQATIDAGHLKIDTNSFAVTVPQALPGTGGVVKSGGGTLTLSGANTYAGDRTVNGGKLAINTSETGTGALTVADTAGFSLTTAVANQVLTVANATFGTTGATTLDMNLGNFAGNATAAPLNVTGTLTLNGVTTINVTDSLPATGIMPLVRFNGAIAGTGSFALGTLPNGVVVSPAVVSVDPNFYGPGQGLVYLDVDSVSLPRWTGAVDGNWDTTTLNWIDQVTNTASTYADPAPVLFNDTGVVTPNVVLNITVAPSAVTFNNATTAYDLSGTGKITGTTGLSKQGAAALHIATANDYTGVTTLTGGTLSADTLANGGVASSIGAAGSSAANLVFAGGTLNYTGPSTTIDRGFTNNAADNTVSSALSITNDLTISGTVNTVFGKFAKQGAGTLTLSNPGANNLASGSFAAPGAFRIEKGALVLNGGGTQTNTVNGEFWVGSTTTDAATATLTNTTLTTNTWLSVGRGNGTTGLVSSFSATGSTITTGSVSMGFANGVVGHLATSALNLTNSTFTTGTTYVSESAGSTGTLTLNSSTYTAGQLIIGRLAGSNGTMSMHGASVSSSTELTIGQDGTSLGALVIDGTSTFSTNNRLLIGNAAGASGSLTIADNGVFNRTGGWLSIGTNGNGVVTVKNNGQFLNVGDFNVSDVGVSQGILNIQDTGLVTSGGTVFVGKNGGTTGTVNQTGGTFNAAGWVSVGRFNTAIGVLNVSAGVFNQNGAGQALFAAEEGTGTINVSGTGQVNVNGVALYVSTINGVNAGTGVVNLDGGTITAKQVTEAGGGGGSGTFNFNGGLLKAGTGASATFMAGLNAANVKAGGANIDSNGQTIAITQALLDGTGGGGLTKSGTGTLQLNAANTYTGTTTVSAGSLGGSGSVAGPLSVSATGAVAPGVAGVGTFTAGASTITGEYTCDVDGATADKLVSNGTLAVSAGKLAINLINTPTAPALVIATYTGATPAPFATVTGLPAGYAINYAYNDGFTSTNIAIVPSATPYDTWASSFGLDPLTTGAPGADADTDGQINSVEFALGGSPISGSDNAKIYQFSADGSVDGDATPELLLTIAVRTGTPAFAGSPSPTATKDGYTYTVQGSLTLSGFTDPVTPVAPVTTGLPAAPAGYEYRTFSLDGTNGLPGTGFMRVTVTP